MKSFLKFLIWISFIGNLSAIQIPKFYDPKGRKLTTFEEWKATCKLEKGFSIKNVYKSKTEKRQNLINIVVNSRIYSGILDSLNVYVSDLESEGYEVRVDTISGSDIFSLRTHLASLLDSGLTGAVFIGEVPIAWYEYTSEEGVEEFPCDLFFMDLNGTWIDSDNDQKFDNHTGNKAPEIWVGRIDASKMTFGDEISFVNKYLSKIHKYREGGFSVPQKALAYVDDDWYSFGNCNLNLLYDTVVVIRQPNTTTAADYRTRLIQDYEWVQVCAHSSPWGQTFKNTSGYAGTVFNFEDWVICPHFLFINFFACSAVRFVEHDYLAGCFLFNYDYGILAIGSTKVGSMLYFDDFYGPLGQGQTIGQAFKSWFIQHGTSSVEWFYGMSICGDPTLKPRQSFKKDEFLYPGFNNGKNCLLQQPPSIQIEPVTTHSETDGYPSMTIDNQNRIWVAWVSGRSTTNGRTEIFVRYRTSSGWSNEQVIDPYLYWDWFPSITNDNTGRIWLSWARAYGRHYNIFGAYYENGWSSSFEISSKTCDDIYPSMITDGSGRIWCVYERWYHLNADIYCRYYQNGSWYPTFAVTIDSANDYQPVLAVDSSGFAWCAWTSERYQNNKNIYVKKYNPITGSWENLRRITSNPAQDYDPTIAVTGDGNIWIAWTTFRNGNPDIYESHFDGTTWSPVRPVVRHPARDEKPFLVVDRDGYLWCIWQSNRTGNWEIFAKYYKDGAWRDSFQITQDTLIDFFPKAKCDANGNIWIIWQKLNGYNWDIYAAHFLSDLVPPNVHVIYPNGGEVFYIGEEETIRWNANDNVQIDSLILEYSYDGGNTWEILSHPSPSETIFVWNVPEISSESSLVRIKAWDEWGNYSFDLSDNFFRIKDIYPPEVMVIYPNGGDTIDANTIDTIKWFSEDNIKVESLKIYLSLDSGQTYTQITRIIGNDSLFEWQVPDTHAEKCLIKIVAYDKDDNTGFDESDSTFVIKKLVDISKRDKIIKNFFKLNRYISNKSFEISFGLEKDGNVEIKVYSINGSKIKEIFSGIKRRGIYKIFWEPKDLAQGTYFIFYRNGKYRKFEKIVYLR
ncbi:MAG: hypothetical protein ABIM13_00460 [candidate division WOR-3 bacterium]